MQLIPRPREAPPNAAEDAEDSALVQRRVPPSQSRGRSRSRSRRGTGRREEDERRAEERRIARTNEHRPWRCTPVTSTSQVMSARPRGSGHRNASSPCTSHPAAITLENGTEANLGLHAWRVMLDMADSWEAASEVNAGVSPLQRDNIRTTLADMTPTQQCQMLTSFLRMVSLLVSEITQAYEDVAAGDEVEVKARKSLTTWT